MSQTSFPLLSFHLSRTLVPTKPSLLPHRDHRKPQTVFSSPAKLPKSIIPSWPHLTLGPLPALVLICPIRKKMATGSSKIPVVLLHLSPCYALKCFYSSSLSTQLFQTFSLLLCMSISPPWQYILGRWPSWHRLFIFLMLLYSPHLLCPPSSVEQVASPPFRIESSTRSPDVTLSHLLHNFALTEMFFLCTFNNSLN